MGNTVWGLVCRIWAYYNNEHGFRLRALGFTAADGARLPRKPNTLSLTKGLGCRGGSFQGDIGLIWGYLKYLRHRFRVYVKLGSVKTLNPKPYPKWVLYSLNEVVGLPEYILKKETTLTVPIVGLGFRVSAIGKNLALNSNKNQFSVSLFSQGFPSV